MEARRGDILVFEADKSSLFSLCIAAITRSSVSHAAMIYDDDFMVEVGGDGIRVNHFHLSDCGDKEEQKVYVLRHLSEIDTSNLIDKADEFIRQDIKFDYPAILILAGLLIYWPNRPTKRWRKAADSIIKLACLVLDRMLNVLIHGKDQKVMVCSEMVYQCYLECGKDYYIKIRDGRLQNGQGYITLSELLYLIQSEEIELNGTLPENLDIEGLAGELYHAFIEAEQANDSELLPQEELYETLTLVLKFESLYKQLLNAYSIELPEDLPMAGVFVTPVDLLKNAVNLSQVDTMRIIRD